MERLVKFKIKRGKRGTAFLIAEAALVSAVLVMALCVLAGLFGTDFLTLAYTSVLVAEIVFLLLAFGFTISVSVNSALVLSGDALVYSIGGVFRKKVPYDEIISLEKADNFFPLGVLFSRDCLNVRFTKDSRRGKRGGWCGILPGPADRDGFIEAFNLKIAGGERK